VKDQLVETVLFDFPAEAASQETGQRAYAAACAGRISRSCHQTSSTTPNGSVKTTILNALTGLVQPRAGSICLEGNECAGRRSDEIVRLGMAQVPQGSTGETGLSRALPGLRSREGTRRSTEPQLIRP
jgi:energy-coupling factor transporter ATP-binding protein EcfA2